MPVIDGLPRPGFEPFASTLPAGADLAVTGPSGSGESVSLRMVVDIDPGEGRVSLDGVDRIAMPAPTWRRRVTDLAAD